MTAQEIIATIRAEIERLKTVQLKRIQEGDLVDAEPYDKNEAYNELTSFLDTLESEKPIEVGEDFEKEYAKFSNDPDAGDYAFPIDLSDYRDFARHFAQWGAEHRGSSEIPNDLEEAASEYSTNEADRVWGKPDPHDYTDHSGCGAAHANYEDGLNVGFKAGAKWDREQMMKEAVEGEVELGPVGKAISVNDEAGGNYWAFGNAIAKRFDLGDKVRIIIVKEDEK